MSGFFTLTSAEIRCLILGKFTARKCPECEGKGIIYFKWEDYTQQISKDISQDEYEESNPLHGSQPCEVCEGVGYKIVDIEEE